ncbi:MAG: hypothetical protein M3Z25_03935 [Actinomycetota bacterium]|nr:hypothetical protein [Actinomycetota bacterium]
MPRHRAPARNRSLTTLALSGAALGGSALYPLTSVAAPAHEHLRHSVVADFNDDFDSDESNKWDESEGDGAGSFDDGRPDSPTRPHKRAAQHHAYNRYLTSGERQYRNGCRQGYITDACEQFDVTHLLQRGIDPYR